jgi:hypothetical protein
MTTDPQYGGSSPEQLKRQYAKKLFGKARMPHPLVAMRRAESVVLTILELLPGTRPDGSNRVPEFVVMIS